MNMVCTAYYGRLVDCRRDQVQSCRPFFANTIICFGIGVFGGPFESGTIQFLARGLSLQKPCISISLVLVPPLPYLALGGTGTIPP